MQHNSQFNQPQTQYVQQYPQQMMYQQQMMPGGGFPQVQAQDPLVQQPILTGAGRQEAGAIGLSGFQKLDAQIGIFIKQKIELAELVLGCETQNRYNVYALNPDGNKKGKQIFKAKESSGYCARNCLSGDCRPFQMNISTTIRGEDDNEYQPFLALDRPCKCTCLCFNRPELRITNVEGGQSQYLGKIVDPWNWCNMEMNIYDQNDTHKYTILGNCCQLGFWCRCPCEPCQTIDFDVKLASGEIVSHLQKRTPGCVQSMTTDMDSFALNFPKDCTAADKALLMCAVLLLDYRHFERNPQQNNA